MSDKLFTKAEVEVTEKGMLAVASTAVEDRHGEIVSVEGWDLKNYKKNPVLQWAHDHTVPAIGIAKNLKIEGTGKKARLVFEPVFHEFTEQAKALKKMVEEKIINSFSVGFRPLEVDGNIYTQQELLEISLVNVPANPEARMLAYKSLHEAGFSDQVAKDIGAWVNLETDPEKQFVSVGEYTIMFRSMKNEIEKLKQSNEELVKGLKHLNPQVDRKQAVINRLTVSKAIARASDKMLEQKPTGNNAVLLKVIKRSSDALINDSKQELKLSGKN